MLNRTTLLASCMLVSALAIGTGCPASAPTAKPRFQYTFPGNTPGGKLAQAWFSGNHTKTNELLTRDLGNFQRMMPEEQFLSAEVHFWRGDVEAAFNRYNILLRENPQHALARHAAARLSELHDNVIDYEARITPTLKALTFQKLHPMTAVYLSVMGQRVHLKNWQNSETLEPFDGNAVGFPTQWMTSPQISPWRLLDFDKDFEIERQTQFKDTYLSPYIAQDSKANYQKTKPFITSSISLSPGLGGDGIYYMETFANVTGDKDQIFWLYGNFPSQASVIIDGVEVLRRTEGNFDTGRRLRRIKLSPGKHRVLVKLAYQRGYRDWFDLSFLNAQATGLSGSNISFSYLKGEEALSKKPMELLSKQAKPSDIEWTMTLPKDVKKADSMALYLTLLSAMQNRQSNFFEPAMNELMRRHSKFGVLYGMQSTQVQTLWELPSRTRNTRALKALREAAKLDPQSLLFKIQLGQWLKKRGKERSVRKLMEDARDGAVVQKDGKATLRNITPLYQWAKYVQNQGWAEDAERAWRKILTVSPNECEAASRVQRILYARKDYVNPKTLVADISKCKSLYNYWVRIHPDKPEEKLALAKRYALKYPYIVQQQLAYVTQLRRMGKPDEALAYLEKASKRIYWSTSMRARLMDHALAGKSNAEALKVLDQNVKDNGPSGWASWRKSMLTQKIPMRDLMRDGVKVAKEIVAQTSGPEAKASVAALAQDEAYYAIDFASKKYFPDGSGLSLTHTMVRVMTKGAIDSHGEVNIPSGARVIVARTIKKDGSVREPELTSGKSTLSMPGLAEGDFVELAYLQYNHGSAWSNTRTIGTKFFFRMKSISSIHSEYVVINPPGQFTIKNNAPAPQTLKYQGQPAVRFLQKNSPKPRPERYASSSDEYLPWVQLLKDGLQIPPAQRRKMSFMEQIKDNTKISTQVTRQLAIWHKKHKKTKGIQKVKGIYYDVMGFVPTPSERSSLTADISHLVVSKEGNPFLLLYKALLNNGIKTDIYLVKSKYEIQDKHPMLEAHKYNHSLLRVVVPGTKDAIWLQNMGDQSMFGAFAHDLKGQPAVCVTCDKIKYDTLPAEPLRPKSHTVNIDAQLDASGALVGSVKETVDGTQAIYVRRLFLRTKEKTARDKIIGNALSSHIQGAAVSKYTIENENDPDKPMTLNVEFVRPGFARVVNGNVLVIEKTFFRKPVESIYGNLARRTLPLFISSPSSGKSSLKLTLPNNKKISVRSKTGKWKHDGEFGQYATEVQLTKNVLTVDTTFALGIQRIKPEDYPTFRKWASNVERSSILLVLMQ